MASLVLPSTEAVFAADVDRLVKAGDVSGLTELLAEDHAAYAERGGAAVVRMRGWILLGLARSGLTDEALPYVLEELESGKDPYLTAAASRALRSYPSPAPEFAPFLIRGLTATASHDEPVFFDVYGEYAGPKSGSTAVRELLAGLEWMAGEAHSVSSDFEALRNRPGLFSRNLAPELERVASAIRSENPHAVCCTLPRFAAWKGARASESVRDTVFEDQDGETVTFQQFFTGRPTIAIFFYTRCDNPRKCSLSVTKLARVQEMLEKRGLGSRIQTAAITYDPAFDLPRRLRDYGERRGLRLNKCHRMLRAPEGINGLRVHFGLRLNFVESLVNRHRIEAYVLDALGRIAYSSTRLQWDEQTLVDLAQKTLRRPGSGPWGAAAAFGLAFFPKCAVCWAAYLNLFGIAELNRLPYAPWLPAVLAGAVSLNIAALAWRARATGRWMPLALGVAGALIIGWARWGGVEAAWPGWGGVALTFCAVLFSARSTKSKT